MGISDLFRAARRQTKQADTASWFGHADMPAEEFQALAQRIRELDRRVDWLTLMGGKASGYLSGSVLGKQTCNLAPIIDSPVVGLLLTTAILPLGPDINMAMINQMLAGIRLIMEPAGASVSVSDEKIWFDALMVRQASRFTDAQLWTLVNMSVTIGDEICRVLITTHQRQVSAQVAVHEFSRAYQEFISAVPADVELVSLEWAKTGMGPRPDRRPAT